jgi:hypothetical protein
VDEAVRIATEVASALDYARLGTWIDAMGWVEQDEDQLAHSEQGWLWIHRAT